MLISLLVAQSLKTVKAALKDEEDEELKREVPLNEMTAATYISSVIALEDQRCANMFASLFRCLIYVQICTRH